MENDAYCILFRVPGNQYYLFPLRGFPAGTTPIIENACIGNSLCAVVRYGHSRSAPEVLQIDYQINNYLIF